MRKEQSFLSEFKKNWIGANVEQKHLKDILNILVVVDLQKGGNLDTVFVAANPNRIPPPGRCSLLSSVENLQQQSEAQKATLAIGKIIERTLEGAGRAMDRVERAL